MFNRYRYHNRIAERTFPLFLISFLLLISCSQTKNLTLFKSLPKDTTINGMIDQKLETKIQKNDLLAISVSSLNAELDQQFNATAQNVAVRSASANFENTGYVVDEGGDINLHFIGKIHAEGLTRRELKRKIETGLLPYMKEPIITVSYKSRKITLMGNLVRPQVIYMNDEQMPLLDALVVAGDFGENAKAEDVMVIRDSSGNKLIKHLNLEDHSVFSSPYYYLQSNDIVYVMSDKAKLDKDERRRTLQTTLSLLASLVSLTVIIINALVK